MDWSGSGLCSIAVFGISDTDFLSSGTETLIVISPRMLVAEPLYVVLFHVYFKRNMCVSSFTECFTEEI
jgi:hypothetical protein